MTIHKRIVAIGATGKRLAVSSNDRNRENRSHIKCVSPFNQLNFHDILGAQDPVEIIRFIVQFNSIWRNGKRGVRPANTFRHLRVYR